MGINRFADIPGIHEVCGKFLVELTTNATREDVVMVAPFDFAVAKVEIAPKGSLSGGNTNYVTLALINKTKSGTPTIASLALTLGVDLVAFTAKTITLSGTAANLLGSEGDVISFKRTHTNAGLATPEMVVRVQIRSR